MERKQASKLPLADLRILDVSWVWAGPLAAQFLADMGAEVIKVESRVHIDQTRFGALPNGIRGERPYDRGGFYQDINRNKFCVTLELNTPQGVKIFKDLVRISDVVIENYSPRVMKNFGLDYAVLRQVKPDIIMISLSGFGANGPYRDYVAYGANIEPMSGLSSLTGYKDGSPTRTGIPYADPVAAFHAAFAVMAALEYRKRTGKGQHIDLAQYETLTRFIGEAILDYSMNKRAPKRGGNRHSFMAPHGAYRCSGEDSWVAIAASSDEEWQALCKCMDMPELINDTRFVDSHSRYKNQDILNEKVNQWTSRHDKYYVMNLLQKAGVAAGAVLTGKDLFQDPHIKARGFFEEVTHPEVGTYPHHGVSVKLSRTPCHIRMPAPLLGEHNKYVLSELLGIPTRDIESFAQSGIIGTEAAIPAGNLNKTEGGNDARSIVREEGKRSVHHP
ncbi:MAG: CoA transferase [Chloroflexi bacterium]|nr:CoA transferase [Chloroflexota bacterium]